MTVVVIGSGIAGISAASELTKKGIKVILLEAQDRIGGRINTIQGEHRKYDLGASWMHDTLVNPLFQIGAKIGVEMTYDDGKINTYTRNGLVGPRERVPACAGDIFTQAQIDYMQGKYRREDTTIDKFAAEFTENWPLITPTQKHLAPRYVQLMELWAAVSWKDLPASQAAMDFEGRNAFVVNGYKDVYDWVFDKIKQEHFELHTNEPVTRLKKDGDTFIVETPNQEYRAGDVICTIPLGPLRSDLFEFELPADLKAAMDQGKMGALGKFFLEFDEFFWPKDVDRFNFIVDEPPLADLPMEPGNHPLMAANTYNQYEGGPPTLFFLSAPPLTQFLEANPDKVFEYMRPFLEAIKLAGKEVIKPRKIYATDWTTNKYFQGTYSACYFGQSFEKGIQPFVDGFDRLRFAGEHTVYDGSGCVHGAYLSGIREASAVIDRIEC